MDQLFDIIPDDYLSPEQEIGEGQGPSTRIERYVVDRVQEYDEYMLEVLEKNKSCVICGKLIPWEPKMRGALQNMELDKCWKCQLPSQKEKLAAGIPCDIGPDDISVRRCLACLEKLPTNEPNERIINVAHTACLPFESAKRCFRCHKELPESASNVSVVMIHDSCLRR